MTTLQAIKQELRLAMNGVASTQMREAGINYHVNFGVELPRLQQIAAQFGQDADVAQQLWSENVRESKILACIMMPTEAMSAQLADLWVEQLPNAEIAELATMLLFVRLPFAPSAAFVWMASDRPLRQVCGFMLMARLLMQGVEFSASALEEFRDQAEACLAPGETTAVSLAARRALDKLNSKLSIVKQ